MPVVVYGDILLALNWWMNFLLLLAVRRTLGGGARVWRLAMGALLGALTCFTLFLPPLSVWWSLLIKLAAAWLMVLAAFRWQGWGNSPAVFCCCLPYPVDWRDCWGHYTSLWLPRGYTS